MMKFAVLLTAISLVLAAGNSPTTLFLRADLVDNGAVRNRADFTGPPALVAANISSSLQVAQSSNGIEGTAFQYPGGQDNWSGCIQNASFSMPRGSFLVVSRGGGCGLDTKNSNAMAAGAFGLIVYNTNATVGDDFSGADDSGTVKSKILVLLLNSAGGKWLEDGFSFVANDTKSSVRLVIAASSDETGPGIWEFTLVIVVILLVFSFIMSVVMHCHLYRLRRWRERNAVANANITMRRINLISAETLETLFPQYAYTVEKRPLTEYLNIRSTLPNQVEEPAIESESDGTTSHMEATSSETILPFKGSPQETISDVTFGLHNEMTCAVCIDELEAEQLVRTLLCRHTFHVECIDPWVTAKNAVCPLCKLNLNAEKPNDSPAEEVLPTTVQINDNRRPRLWPRWFRSSTTDEVASSV